MNFRTFAYFLMEFGLSPEKEEILMNFQAITENWDIYRSIQILDRNAWNLNKATLEAFNEFNGFSSPEARFVPGLSQNSYMPTSQFTNTPTSQRPNIPTTQNPRSSQTNKKSGFGAKLKSLFNEVFVSSLPIISTAAESFLLKLLSQKPAHVPNFGKKILKDMLEEAKTHKKILLLYIDCDEVPSNYIQNIFCNELSAMIINDYYIGWGVHKDTNEGQTGIQALKAEKFPCIAAVKVDDPANPIIIEKLEGVYIPEKIIEFLSRNYVTRPVVTERDKKLEEERKIRATQEKELKEAERILKKRQMEEEKLRKEKKIQIVGDEPTGNDAALVSFRLPNGSKIERKFGKERKVQVLYDFLSTQGYDNIVLLYGFPSTPFSDLSASLESCEIYPKAVVIVKNAE